VAIKCVGLIPVDKLRIMRIKNTARLSEIDISEGYQEDLSQRTDLEIVRKEGPMTFDSAGNFPPF
ncbi:MAG: hypothetical protein P8Y00_03255, partial [Deltaproteobacteria bacterium]